MKLALIAPVSLLDRYASQSDGVHLILTQTVLASPVYAEWYRKRSEAGDTIILDNNAYETREPATMLEIMEAAERTKATTIVAPDYPSRPWRDTWKAFVSFTEALPEPYKVFGCPQSEPGDIEGWLYCVHKMLTWSDRVSHVGMSILACPTAFHLLTGTEDIEVNRMVATTFVKHRFGNYPWFQDSQRRPRFHYLGLGTRLDMLPYYDIADSLDTKGPIKAGLNELMSDGQTMPRGTSEKLDLLTAGLDVEDSRHAKIQFNINTLKARMLGAIL